MGLKRIRLRLAIHPSLLSHLTEGELQKHNYRRKFDVIVAHNKYNAALRFSSPVKYFTQNMIALRGTGQLHLCSQEHNPGLKPK
jgi:hypothetical protein